MRSKKVNVREMGKERHLNRLEVGGAVESAYGVELSIHHGQADAATP